MTQHETIGGVCVVRHYVVDTLGAPFKVTLVNGVTMTIDPASGKERVDIPDTIGLIGAVIRARSLHPRKMNGEEIKFIRKGLSVQAKSLADFLDMSPEHFSRCEAGVKTLSTNSEKMLRMFAHWASLYENPEALLAKVGEQKTSAKKSEHLDHEEEEFVEKMLSRFWSMKIQPVFDPSDELHFVLERRPRRRKLDKPKGGPADDKIWSDEPELSAA